MGELLALAILLAVIALVIARLPKVDVGHTDAFRRRRVMNWLPIGLMYAFLYMARYNLKKSQEAFQLIENASGDSIMDSAGFATIFGVGTAVYAFSFIINGPLTDRFGGRRVILLAAVGAAVSNVAMGFGAWTLLNHGPLYDLFASKFLILFSLFYGVNMYFQSFGAVAIVKVNAPWFHVRERGVFGAIFGILISLGVYFAYDWSRIILDNFGLANVFFVPAGLLVLVIALVAWLTRDTPGEAGFEDFDAADQKWGKDGENLSAARLFAMMLTNPIILIIASIEFCSGYLRQAIQQWYTTYADQTDAILHLKSAFVNQHWGILLCAAGIMAATVAGVISDHVFQSRRGPVAALLYGAVLGGSVLLTFVYATPMVGWLVVFMYMAVVGVHGMLSGTASMDFGGKQNVGKVVGIIDGFVYLGSTVMSFVYARLIPETTLEDGALTGPGLDPATWWTWPVGMIPLAVVGLLLASRIWNAKPTSRPTPPADAAASVEKAA
ncbi:MAG: MFS transporter [Sandaracinaceae bacterium]